MDNELTNIAETVQKLVVQLLATNPCGEGLCLIGGFRYRLLDSSCRQSLDIDYHWAGDLGRKQSEIVTLLRKKLVPLVRDRMGFDCSVNPATGPDADSPAVKTVEVAVWQKDGHIARIAIPLDITRIPCADKPVVRTVAGVVYLSVSDADMVESKVVAIFSRQAMAERDMVDAFLFRSKFVSDSAERVGKKLSQLQLSEKDVSTKLKKIVTDRRYHVRNIEGILRSQVEPQTTANIDSAGGAGMIFDQVVELLQERLRLAEGK